MSVQVTFSSLICSTQTYIEQGEGEGEKTQQIVANLFQIDAEGQSKHFSQTNIFH